MGCYRAGPLDEEMRGFAPYFSDPQLSGALPRPDSRFEDAGR
jgi:hypothetical protein